MARVFDRYADRMENVERLMVYAELMGFTGKDLAAIGGAMDRKKTTELIRANIDRVDQAFNLIPTSEYDKNSKWSIEYALNRGWKVKTATGTYVFTPEYYSVEIRNTVTKAVRNHSNTNYDWPRHWSWTKQTRYAAMLDVLDGKLALNF